MSRVCASMRDIRHYSRRLATRLLQDGYALGEGVGEGEFEVAFEANAGSQQATLHAGQVAYIATGDMTCSMPVALIEGCTSSHLLHAAWTAPPR